MSLVLQLCLKLLPILLILQLYLATNSQAEQIRYRIAREAAPNAYTKDSEITLTSGIIQLLADPEEIEFVIAHELGHIILGHSQDRSSVQQEIAADNFAARLVGDHRVAVLDKLSKHFCGLSAESQVCRELGERVRW